MPATEAFRKAVKAAGGQKTVADLVGCAQSTISGYVTGGNAPADVCMKLETATGGAYRAEDMRPDLAETFRAFRQSRPLPADRSEHGQEAA